jgi:hypothetical protein
MGAAGWGLGELGSCVYIASSPGAFGVLWGPQVHQRTVEKLVNGREGLSRGDRKWSYYDGRSATFPRRTCSPRHGVPSCRGESAGVANLPLANAAIRNFVWAGDVGMCGPYLSERWCLHASQSSGGASNMRSVAVGGARRSRVPPRDSLDAPTRTLLSNCPPQPPCKPFPVALPRAWCRTRSTRPVSAAGSKQGSGREV